MWGEALSPGPGRRGHARMGEGGHEVNDVSLSPLSHVNSLAIDPSLEHAGSHGPPLRPRNRRHRRRQPPEVREVPPRYPSLPLPPSIPRPSSTSFFFNILVFFIFNLKLTRETLPRALIRYRLFGDTVNTSARMVRDSRPLGASFHQGPGFPLDL